MAVKLRIKVVPRASRTELAGWHGDRLRIRLAAVPADGRANAELIGFLATTLGVPRRAIELVSGQTSTLKTVAIKGLDQRAVAARLA